MVGDVSGTKCLKLIWDVSEAIEGLLNIFVVESFEAVEEIAKDTDCLISLGWDAFIDLGEPVPD